jgi:hypothetical protein
MFNYYTVPAASRRGQGRAKAPYSIAFLLKINFIRNSMLRTPCFRACRKHDTRGSGWALGKPDLGGAPAAGIASAFKEFRIGTPSGGRAAS